MKASIIIPTYNRPIFLERAINSALKQNFDDYEIIIIDDNGLNTKQQIATKSLLKKFKTKVLKYIPLEKNLGGCIARNHGVQEASGEYIFFLDDDDEFLPNKLKYQIEYLEKNLEYDGCLSSFKRLSENGNEIISKSNFPITGDFKNFSIYGNFFTHMICIRRKSFIQSKGFVDISRYQDRYFMLHCLDLNMRFKDLNEQLFVIYEHQGERVSSKNLEVSVKSLTTIKNFIELRKSTFSKVEWKNFEYVHMRSLAVLHYVHSSYFIKLRGIQYWIRLFFMKFKLTDFLMLLKTIVPNI